MSLYMRQCLPEYIIVLVNLLIGEIIVNTFVFRDMRSGVFFSDKFIKLIHGLIL